MANFNDVILSLFLEVGRSLIFEMRLLKGQTGEGLISLLATDLKMGLTMNKQSSIYASVLTEKNSVFIGGMLSFNPKLLSWALTLGLHYYT